MDISAIITVRKQSKRIKNKALIKINSETISKIKLDQASRQKLFQNKYFSSNISQLNLYAKKKGFNLLSRPKKFFLDSTVSQIAPYLANKVLDDHICYLMVTSPLITDKTLKNCLEIYKKLDFKKYDSLSTFSKINDFLWNDKKPINYDLNKQPRSQDLTGFYRFIPAVTIISRKNLIKYRNVIGKKPYKVIIDFPENIDIDENYQYEIANFINKKNNLK